MSKFTWFLFCVFFFVHKIYDVSVCKLKMYVNVSHLTLPVLHWNLTTNCIYIHQSRRKTRTCKPSFIIYVYLTIRVAIFACSFSSSFPRGLSRDTIHIASLSKVIYRVYSLENTRLLPRILERWQNHKQYDTQNTVTGFLPPEGAVVYTTNALVMWWEHNHRHCSTNDTSKLGGCEKVKLGWFLFTVAKHSTQGQWIPLSSSYRGFLGAFSVKHNSWFTFIIFVKQKFKQ